MNQPRFGTAEQVFESDQDYFFRRSEEERRAAELTEHHAAKAAHLEMSARYALLAAAIHEAAARIG